MRGKSDEPPLPNDPAGPLTTTTDDPRDPNACLRMTSRQPPSYRSPVSPLVFRPATPADTSAVVELVQSAYRGESSQKGWTTEADLLDGQRTDAEAVSGLLSRQGSRLLLALRDGTLLGCCHIERKAAEKNAVKACYFGMFAVTPTLQGGGVGGALLTEAERHARVEWGCGEMHMTVIDVRAELIAWYERRGYRRTGEHSPFPYGNDRFGLPKRPDLRFELLVKGLGVDSRP